MSDRFTPGLARRLGTGDAVVIGLGSMVGAGVFAAFAPAAEAAGAALLVGLGIAYQSTTAASPAAKAQPRYERREEPDWGGGRYAGSTSG